MEWGDVPGVRGLCGQLGYPATDEQIRRRFAQLAGDRDHQVFVAQDDAGRLLGCLHVESRRALVVDPFVQVFVLVVDAEHRNRRLGERLIREGERWAREHGVAEMHVYTNVVRTDAHRFYRRLGYREAKTSHILHKTL